MVEAGSCGGRGVNEQCWYCGCGLKEWMSENHPREGKINRCRVKEHQTPKSKGGRQIVLACVSCNSQKGTKDVEQYRVYLRGKYSTMKAANALRETLSVLPADFGKQIEIVAESLEFLTPAIVFFGEKKGNA